MRLLGTLPDASAAHSFAEYLLSKDIESRLLPAAEGLEIWIIDEDRLPQARQELADFQRDASQKRFRQAAPKAASPEAEPRSADAEPRWTPPTPENQITVSLMVFSFLITALLLSPGQKELILTHLFISKLELIDGAPWGRTVDNLDEVRKGEVWRLLTPIFVHFDVLHLFFNLLWMWQFGRAIEHRAGYGWYVALLLFIAIPANLAQYYLGNVRLDDWRIELGGRSLYFGGLSGVVFGLFGFIWIKSIYHPASGYEMSRGTSTLLIVWLFLCMIPGVIGEVANAAHLAGLALGMLAGYASARWYGFEGAVSLPSESKG